MMADAPVSTQPRFRISSRVMMIALTRSVFVTAIILFVAFKGDLDALRRYGGVFSRGYAHPHVPDLAPLIAGGPAVLIHVGTVLGALAIGTVLMSGVKGTILHRTLGWTWVVFMLATAVTTLFIHRINPGGLSLLHLFSAYALIATPIAVAAARKHKVGLHGRLMLGSYAGALLVAGVTSFLPGRIMWQVFFSWR
jgi:uncharacterized membrane protein